jgi:hypothetical protein
MNKKCQVVEEEEDKEDRYCAWVGLVGGMSYVLVGVEYGGRFKVKAKK